MEAASTCSISLAAGLLALISKVMRKDTCIEYIAVGARDCEGVRPDKQTVISIHSAGAGPPIPERGVVLAEELLEADQDDSAPVEAAEGA